MQPKKSAVNRPVMSVVSDTSGQSSFARSRLFHFFIQYFRVYLIYNHWATRNECLSVDVCRRALRTLKVPWWIRTRLWWIEHCFSQENPNRSNVIDHGTKYFIDPNTDLFNLDQHLSSSVRSEQTTNPDEVVEATVRCWYDHEFIIDFFFYPRLLLVYKCRSFHPITPLMRPRRHQMINRWIYHRRHHPSTKHYQHLLQRQLEV